ncbi:MAG: hypothetical protein HYV45_02940 [Candidatus Moranbacteria bacterium]|nr:hypothetical protein [Candidatus Moranbacteria bacterium]
MHGSYQLGKNILATITYYDVLGFPLTAFEIWKHLMSWSPAHRLCDQPCTLGAVSAMLTSEQLVSRIDTYNGFYFLRGRGFLVAARIQAEKTSVSKLKRMHFLVKILRMVPYVRMIGATGSLAMKNGDQGSDWDMFVVLRSGRIWTGRTLLTGFLHVLGKRRHGKKIKDRVCLNYFVTENNLEIGTKDFFSAHEYRFFIPLMNQGLFQKFELKNFWIREFRPNFELSLVPSFWTLADSSVFRRIQSILERMCNNVDKEQWLASWQKRKIERNPKTHLSGSLIEANDRALIFLPCPRGPKVFEKFKSRLSI